jgi:hypothetical protein
MEKFLSRKFLVALGAALSAFVGSFWPDKQQMTDQIINVAMAYIFTEGTVDAVARIVTAWVAKKEAI